MTSLSRCVSLEKVSDTKDGDQCLAVADKISLETIKILFENITKTEHTNKTDHEAFQQQNLLQ